MTDDAGMVKSDTTLFAILESLRELERAGVTRIADDLGLAKSTVHKHLKTLHRYGYVVGEDGSYRLGLRFLDIGTHARDILGFYHAIEPKMQQLASSTGERSSCIVEEMGEGVFVGSAIGEDSVQTSVRMGTRCPLHCTAGGKAIMAHLPDERRRELFEGEALPACTDRTRTDPEALADELEEIRERGYACGFEEWIEGLHAVAAPVRDPDGTVYGTIGVAGAAYRLTTERCHGELKDLVLAAANEVELNLTYE